MARFSRTEQGSPGVSLGAATRYPATQVNLSICLGDHLYVHLADASGKRKFPLPKRSLMCMSVCLDDTGAAQLSRMPKPSLE